MSDFEEDITETLNSIVNTQTDMLNLLRDIVDKIVHLESLVEK